ncbi:ExeA family protein [Zavarzinella formosa]|uniref:ExeA family protein n=1 Tax=Zavarzinella formosa TaxID=360055 RepID=UPI0002E11549|nr:AAA family ATPase [Zavarzinella formosa]
MYDSQFGLRRRPFRPTPDTDAYYPATGHERVLEQLRHAIDDEEGLILLTAEAGVGKTIIARRLLETFEEEIRPVLLTNSHFAERVDLLHAVLYDLGLPYLGLGEQDARIAVTESCLEFFAEGGKTLIVLDEAQHLPPELLEELRLLSNLEGKDGRAVQVLLFAMPDFEKCLDRAGMASFRQRLSIRLKLEPLSLEESADYLLHQVRVAGGKPDRLFGEDVLDILTHAANGVPRVLNQAAHLAFNLAAENGLDYADSEAAVEAITRLGLDPLSDNGPMPPEDDRAELVSVPMAEIISVEPMKQKLELRSDSHSRSTIPFPPMILPIENGPPTFVYGGDDGDADGAKHSGTNRLDAGSLPWASPSDRVG